jgi:peptidoglycan/LPS O-acetylase OafA/YrhL
MSSVGPDGRQSVGGPEGFSPASSPLSPPEPDRARGRDNAFGALRLILASMVIFAHCPEMLDGTRAREPATWLFHTNQTLGSIAVDGFFLLSGYLIAGSFISDPRGYFRKRILRIYPAFIACSLISVFVIGPLAGGALPVGREWARMLYRMAILQTPLSDGAFSTLHFATLNASMWTIAYEFRCYILAAAFGVIGLYSRPRVFLGLTLALLAMTLVPLPETPARFNALLGLPANDVRLCSVFMAGTCFRLIPMRLKATWAAMALLALIPLMFIERASEIAVVLLGGYCLFWVAFQLDWKPLRTFNAKDDISYGVYLWGWPVASLLIWYAPAISLGVLDALTLAGAAICGWVSWRLIERPAMRLRPSVPQGRRTAADAAH